MDPRDPHEGSHKRARYIVAVSRLILAMTVPTDPIFTSGNAADRISSTKGINSLGKSAGTFLRSNCCSRCHPRYDVEVPGALNFKYSKCFTQTSRSPFSALS